jgi:hypothetical protein
MFEQAEDVCVLTPRRYLEGLGSCFAAGHGADKPVDVSAALAALDLSTRPGEGKFPEHSGPRRERRTTPIELLPAAHHADKGSPVEESYLSRQELLPHHENHDVRLAQTRRAVRGPQCCGTSVAFGRGPSDVDTDVLDPIFFDMSVVGERRSSDLRRTPPGRRQGSERSSFRRSQVENAKTVPSGSGFDRRQVCPMRSCVLFATNA